MLAVFFEYIILHKVPPKYTYVCQPADISWNKPFKGELRNEWILSLKNQLVAHRVGESERQRKKDKLNAKILLIHKSDDREQAFRKVVCLRKKLDNIRSHLAAPSRPQMTDWITSSWAQLTKNTIISGFTKAGIGTDTRETSDDNVRIIEVDGLIEDLAR
ncbi:hypothetical protein PHMEG_00032994 [Phytophthora megakarya]|uniref:DDE-1 domain-containing protein n=1 Tax=Phytophthora megakarya TaxID=4795 RepID=A0A225UUR5_9STRA|nr:hypothetical protein PHMEG_00032994 [Phytophthora megakarya]